MKDFSLIYDLLRELIQEFRKEIDVPIAQFCADSGVSTRTYAKLKKHLPVKPECYVRLVIGFCRIASPEEFMKFWKKFGEWLYSRYSEG